MAALEAYYFNVEVLDNERVRRGVGANAVIGALNLIEPRSKVEKEEDWQNPLVWIGGRGFPGFVCLSIVGDGAPLAVVQTWDMPRPDKYRKIPGGAALAPTMSDNTTGVSAFILANLADYSAKNIVVAKIWQRNLAQSEHRPVDALPLLLQS